MKKLIIYSVQAVGMHHHGNRSLTIGEGYIATHKPENAYDVNAIAIYEREKVSSPAAYLRRIDAAIIAKIFRANLVHDKMLLKPKFEPKYRPRIGPTQTCNVGFYCKPDNIEAVLEILNNSHLQFKVL